MTLKYVANICRQQCRFRSIPIWSWHCLIILKLLGKVFPVLLQNKLMMVTLAKLGAQPIVHKNGTLLSKINHVQFLQKAKKSSQKLLWDFQMALTEVSMQKSSLNTKEHGYPDRAEISVVWVAIEVARTRPDQIDSLTQSGHPCQGINGLTFAAKYYDVGGQTVIPAEDGSDPQWFEIGGMGTWPSYEGNNPEDLRCRMQVIIQDRIFKLTAHFWAARLFLTFILFSIK